MIPIITFSNVVELVAAAFLVGVVVGGWVMTTLLKK
jgi:hypothetical protein